MFHCLVIKVCCVYLSDSSFILSHLFLFVKNFFQVFSNFFELRFHCRFVDDLDTLSYLLSFVNSFFVFSETYYCYLLRKNNLLSTTLIEYHLFQYLSTCFLQKIQKNLFFPENPTFTCKNRIPQAYFSPGIRFSCCY